MTPKSTKCLLLLAEKTRAILCSGIDTLLNWQAKAGNTLPAPDIHNDYNESGNFSRPVLKPKLNLKQNQTDRKGYMLSMHASHYSYSSHYSSCFSYTPCKNIPYRPSSVVQIPKQHKNPYSNYKSENKSQYIDSQALILTALTRVLPKTRESDDIKALQNILARPDYNIILTAYFGGKTEEGGLVSSRTMTQPGRPREETFSICKTNSNKNLCTNSGHIKGGRR